MRPRIIGAIAMLAIVLIIPAALPSPAKALVQTGGSCATWQEELYLNTFDNNVLGIHHAYGSAALYGNSGVGCRLTEGFISEQFIKNGNVVDVKGCSESADSGGHVAIDTSECYDGGASRPGSFKATANYSLSGSGILLPAASVGPFQIN